MLQRDHANADEFLGLLSYIIIQCNPPNLISNLQYVVHLKAYMADFGSFVETYRHMDMLQSSWGYFLTTLSIAVDYISNKMDPTSLHITEPKCAHFQCHPILVHQ